MRNLDAEQSNVLRNRFCNIFVLSRDFLMSNIVALHSSSARAKITLARRRPSTTTTLIS